MKSMKLAFLSILAALALAACAAGKPAWTGDPELARKITVNMPADEVRKLMGEPSSTGEFELAGLTTRYWDYDGSKDVRVIMQGDKVKAVTLSGATILEASVSEI